MKIAQYNDMMSHLTRQNFEEGLSAKVDRIKEYDKGVEEGTKLFLRQDVLQKLYEKNLITEEEFLNLTKELKEQFQPRLEKEETMVEESAFPETKRKEFREGTKTKLVEFVEKFKSENNRAPTIMEVANGTKSSTKSVRKYLEEGVDFIKTDLSTVGKKGGDVSGAAKKTGVTKLNEKAYKELQDLRIKGLSFQVDTGVGGSKSVRVTIQNPEVSKAFFGNNKTLSFTADAKGIEQAKNLVEQIAVSDVYKDNVLPFQTDEYKLKIRRLKDKMYRQKDPFGIYEKLSDYKSKIFPEGMAKKIQIQHGDAKFTTQTLSRMGLIDAAANISPEVQRVEKLRSNALKIALATLNNPDASVAAKKAAAEKYNSIAKGLRGQLKGTEGQGLVNFQLLEVDDSGNYKKLKDISFDPKRGLVDSDLDLSKITKEEANELIAKGKKKLDLEAINLKTGLNLKTADKAPIPEKTKTINMFKQFNENMNNAKQKIKTAINQGGGDVCEAIVGAAKPKMFTGGALPSKCQQAIQILEDDPIRAMNNIDLIQKSSKAIQLAKKAVGGFGKGLIGIDLPIIQAAFLKGADFAEDNPLLYTVPAAFTDFTAKTFNLYEKSKGKLGNFMKLAASSGVPRFLRSPLFKAATKVGKVGSTFALPALEIAQEGYKYNRALNRLEDEARNFNIPIEKAREDYDKYIRMNRPVIQDEAEIPEMSDRGQANLDSIKRGIQQLGSILGLSDDPYADKTPAQPSAFHPMLTKRRDFFSGNVVRGLPALFKKAAQVSEKLRNLKNSAFESWNNVRMFGEQEGVARNLESFTNIPEKNRKIATLEDIENLRLELPEKYHKDLAILKKSIEQNNFETAWKQYEQFEKDLDPTLKFENIPEEYFPMLNPLNDAFVITGPRTRIQYPRYSYRTSMEIDPATGKPTGKYQTEQLELYDAETGTFRDEPVLVGVDTDKGKEGLN